MEIICKHNVLNIIIRYRDSLDANIKNQMIPLIANRDEGNSLDAISSDQLIPLVYQGLLDACLRSADFTDAK